MKTKIKKPRVIMEERIALARDTFIRLALYDLVKDLVKEARRVKYKVRKDADWWVEARDPEAGDALVFKATQVRPGLWAISYAKGYWEENVPADTDPRTPVGFQQHITASPVSK